MYLGKFHYNQGTVSDIFKGKVNSIVSIENAQGAGTNLYP